MAIPTNIHLDFNNDFEGIASAPERGISTAIGRNGLYPYELLYSALGSCLYATLLEILEKRRITIDGVAFDISGIKRDEIPAFLRECRVTAVVRGAADDAKTREKITKSMALASEYCSIYQTLSKVATMEWKVSFAD